MSSSIRALANSLGIKRASDKANASLTKHAVPFEDLTPATPPYFEPAPLSTPDVEALKAAARAAADNEDDGDISMSAPVPGSPSRPGAPAPENARLSMGQGPTTTIRLINSKQTAGEAPGTPVLPKFQTDFDLILGSPNPRMTPGQVVSVWPASPERQGGRLYPPVPFEDLLPTKPSSNQVASSNAGFPSGIGGTPAKKFDQPLVKGTPTDAPDMFSPMRPIASTKDTADSTKPDTSKLNIPRDRDEPFLFGSPLPRHSLSNQQFSATAQGLVEEMHRRLAAQDKGGASTKSSAPPVFGTLERDSGTGGGKGSPDRFAKAHEAAFSKMDSIANHYAARRPLPQPPAGANANAKKRKSEALGLGPAPAQKRKSSAAGARVISAGARKRMAVPGGFGADDDDDDEEDELIEEAAARRSSKRVRVSEVDGVHNGKRVSIAPAAGRIQEGAEPGEEEAKKLKEREAIRRRLEASKARRRSSRGRVSVGGKAAPREFVFVWRSGSAPDCFFFLAKAKPSRFGFFASAKSLVKNVWGMGGGSGANNAKPAPAASSSIPVVKPTPATAPAKPAVVPPPVAQHPSVRSTTSTARKSSVSTSAKLQKPRPESQAATSGKGNDTIKSSRSSTAQTRAPIPSFASPPSGTASSRMSTSTAASKIPSRPSSIAGASSLGTRTSLATTRTQGAASSIGTRRSMAATSLTGNSTSTRTSTVSSQGAREKDAPPPPRTRTSSLLSPTASSLARMVGKPDSSAGRHSALPAVAEQLQPAKRAPRKSVATTKAALRAATNSPRSPQSPRPTRIFSQPLTADALSSPLSQHQRSPSPVYHTSLTTAATALASPSRKSIAERPVGCSDQRRCRCQCWKSIAEFSIRDLDRWTGDGHTPLRLPAAQYITNTFTQVSLLAVPCPMCTHDVLHLQKLRLQTRKHTVLPRTTSHTHDLDCRTRSTPAPRRGHARWTHNTPLVYVRSSGDITGECCALSEEPHDMATVTSTCVSVADEGSGDVFNRVTNVCPSRCFLHRPPRDLAAWRQQCTYSGA